MKTNNNEEGTIQRFVDVRDPHDGALLFRYDPQRRLVEIRKRKIVRLVDLTLLYPVDDQRNGAPNSR